MRWSGKEEVLVWLDEYYDRVLATVQGRNRGKPLPCKTDSAASVQYPWDSFSIPQLVRFSEHFAGSLDSAQFCDALTAMLGARGTALGSTLFKAFDQDGIGSIDSKEAFAGLLLLFPRPAQERLAGVFMVVDRTQQHRTEGRISQRKLEDLLRFVAPPGARSSAEVRAFADRMFVEVHTTEAGLISYKELMAWPGHRLVMGWVDAFRERVLLKVNSAQRAQHSMAAVTSRVEDPQFTQQSGMSQNPEDQPQRHRTTINMGPRECRPDSHSQAARSDEQGRYVGQLYGQTPMRRTIPMQFMKW